MLGHEFMRNAYLAGTFVALACGAIGYFVVLRAQVFAGDALSHVAFAGALGAAAIGIDIRLGLFAATILVGAGLGGLGERARADDVVIGTVFAWMGVGVSYRSSASARCTGTIKSSSAKVFNNLPSWVDSVACSHRLDSSNDRCIERSARGGQC